LKIALYPGCTVQSEQYAFEMSARCVFPKLGVKLIDIDGFSCCGYPLRSVSSLGWIYLSARNLALAERRGLDIMPLCNGCHLTLCEAKYYLEENPKLKERVNSLLSIEGLKYKGKSRVVHILEILHDYVGIKKIQNSVKISLKGLRLAPHYGCHAIRPSKLGRPDDPEEPKKLEKLIEALGANTDEYPELLDCCGSGSALSASRVALSIAAQKLKAVQKRGFDAMVVICPFCMKMFDSKQHVIRAVLHEDINLPVLYYTQLLGLAMGLKLEDLGLNLNLSPVGEILNKLRGS